MFKPLRSLTARLRRFRRETRGSLTVESVFIVPIMALGLTAFYAFWDVYRTQNMVQKGSYAVADMLSREMIPATPAFLDGLERTLEFLIREDARVRITSLRRISGGPTGVTGLTVLWSYSPANAMQVLNNTSLVTVERHIPMMAVGSNMVLFEVQVPYNAVTDLLDVDTLNEVVAMRPRFLPTLCLTNTAC